MTKTVHLGSISLNNENMFTDVRATRHELIYELNSWFFDYFYANRIDITSLPPLDDWTHSQENSYMWHITFPTSEWLVSIRSAFLEFK